MSNTKAARRRDQVIEDVEWIAGFDHPDNIARRLGYSSEHSLTAQLQHWGRHDLATRVTSGYRTVLAAARQEAAA